MGRKQESIAKMLMMREKDEEFDVLVKEIEEKIEAQIKEKNEQKSYYPKGSKEYIINIKVRAVPITKEQKNCLLLFLKDKYIEDVAGNYVTMEKCWLSDEYRVKSHWYGMD